jgi:hypothetical protein
MKFTPGFEVHFLPIWKCRYIAFDLSEPPSRCAPYQLQGMTERGSLSTSPRVLHPVLVWPLFNFYFYIMAWSPATAHWWRHAPQPWTCKYLQNNDYVTWQPNGTSKYASKQCQCGSFLSFFCCNNFTLIWQADVFSVLEFTSYLFFINNVTMYFPKSSLSKHQPFTIHYLLFGEA